MNKRVYLKKNGISCKSGKFYFMNELDDIYAFLLSVVWITTRNMSMKSEHSEHNILVLI